MKTALGKLRHQRLLAFFLLLVALLIPPALIAYVHLVTRDRIYVHNQNITPQRVALVFGAGLRQDGRPGRMLADRVAAAAELYHAGRVEKLLMSGDNSSLEYNEVAAMRTYAEELGVSPDDITLDYAGFRTYETCYRARAIFGVEQAILITQRFHMPRAVYTCQSLGIDVVGLGTSDWGHYHALLMARHSLREALATLNALWELHVTRPRPTFLGPFEEIT